MNPIWGSDVILKMKVGDEFVPIFCGIDTTYQCLVELIEKTGPNSGGIRQKMTRLEEHVSSVTGATYVENDDTLSFFYTLQEGIRREEQEFQMYFVDELGNERTLTGAGILGTQSINGPVGDFSTANLEIHWNEAPQFDVVDPPEENACIEIPLYIPFLEGETSVSHADLEETGVEILGVERTGTGLKKTTGTPAAGSLEYKFTGGAGNGTIEVDANNPSQSNDEYIYVLYKIT
jgi:hypothetical protein